METGIANQRYGNITVEKIEIDRNPTILSFWQASIKIDCIQKSPYLRRTIRKSIQAINKTFMKRVLLLSFFLGLMAVSQSQAQIQIFNTSKI